MHDHQNRKERDPGQVTRSSVPDVPPLGKPALASIDGADRSLTNKENNISVLKA